MALPPAHMHVLATERSRAHDPDAIFDILAHSAACVELARKVDPEDQERTRRSPVMARQPRSWSTRTSASE